MKEEPAIRFTDDGKGKRQSVEARWEFESVDATGFLSFSATAWGADHREALANLFAIIVQAGIAIDPKAQTSSEGSGTSDE